MASMSVLGAGFPFDDLRVEELEPRLEFMAGGGCLDFVETPGCDFCLTRSGDLDFACDGSG